MTLPASTPATPAPCALPALEAPLAAIEECLAALGEGLRNRDNAAIETHAGGLHRALAHAVDEFSRAARQGQVTPALRRRLAQASGQVAAQREVLARATAALDRAIDVLLPRETGVLYGAQGVAERGPRGGLVQA